MAHLPFLACEFEGQLTVAAGLLVLLEIEVAVTKVAECVRLRVRSTDGIDHALDQPQAFLAVAAEQRAVSEVRDDRNTAERLRRGIARAIAIQTSERIAEALDRLLELRVGLVHDAELVENSQLPERLLGLICRLERDLSVED